MMKFEDRVLIYEDRLSDTDDQIIEFIKANKEDIIHLSIQKLADKLFIAPNTILRLSRKLNYEGFSELKLYLKQESFIRTTKHSEIANNIVKTYEIMDMDTIDKVVKKMIDSNNVLFYGVGDSLPFCEMMFNNLKCVGSKAEFFIHRHDMIYSAEKVSLKDLVFTISISGETKQVIEAVTIAKDTGASIVSLTHLCENPLAKLACLNLYCWAPKQKLNNYDVTDRTSLMIVLRKLSQHYWDLC